MNPLTAMALTPLDRVLVAQDMATLRRYGHTDCWYYFVGYTSDGQLEVARPGGSVRTIHWHQVESIEKREPVIVRALSNKGFCNKLAADSARKPFTPEWHPAMVIMANIGIRGQVEGFRLRLTNGDEWSNASRAIIHDDDYSFLNSIANRGEMPVYTWGHKHDANAAEQAGLDARQAKTIIKKFFAAALTGKRVRTDHDLPMPCAKSLGIHAGDG